MTRVGVIGVGRMGGPMARRLLAAGHQLTVCDPSEGAVQGLCALGAGQAEDPAGAAAAAEITITCLPSPEIIESVVLGKRGVLAGALPDGIIVDMSTSLPSLARRLAGAGKERGVPVLDAPVTGGPRGAKAGTLAIMVGGDASAFERALPLFEAMGKVVRHMGPAGSGQATKLTNNVLAATHMAVLAEAVALARSEGLDPAAVYEIVSNGTGDSRVLRNRYPVPGVLPDAPASNEWAPLFPVDLIAKDVRLALTTAREHGLTLPVAEMALTRYREAQEAEFGELDYSAVARLFGVGE
ncbi:MAG TPA: NAD(P)-dependent oxidoreductase [Solirubrobacteraceae bacterium]|nr:NAD(P)-dependent oxidoreductase [Solirubrobacteraceae bacterium]